MKITRSQIRRIIKEQSMAAPQVVTMIEEAVLESVYDIVAENDLSDGMQVPDDIVQAIADGLRRAANTFTKEQGF